MEIVARMDEMRRLQECANGQIPSPIALANRMIARGARSETLIAESGEISEVAKHLLTQGELVRRPKRDGLVMKKRNFL